MDEMDEKVTKRRAGNAKKETAGITRMVDRREVFQGEEVDEMKVGSGGGYR